VCFIRGKRVNKLNLYSNKFPLNYFNFTYPKEREKALTLFLSKIESSNRSREELAKANFIKYSSLSCRYIEREHWRKESLVNIANRNKH